MLVEQFFLFMSRKIVQNWSKNCYMTLRTVILVSSSAHEISQENIDNMHVKCVIRSGESFRKLSEKYKSGVYRLTIGIDQIVNQHTLVLRCTGLKCFLYSTSRLSQLTSKVFLRQTLNLSRKVCTITYESIVLTYGRSCVPFPVQVPARKWCF